MYERIVHGRTRARGNIARAVRVVEVVSTAEGRAGISRARIRSAFFASSSEQPHSTRAGTPTNSEPKGAREKFEVLREKCTRTYITWSDEGEQLGRGLRAAAGLGTVDGREPSF